MSPPRNARLARVSPQEAKKLLGRPGEFLESPPSCRRRLLAAALCSLLLAGCATKEKTGPAGIAGQAADIASDTVTSVIGGPLIPNATVALGPSVSYPLEKLVYWGAWVGAAWLILDPLSPNWRIEEARLPENHYHLSLSMKRYYAGGAGEARAIFHRRAKELMRAGGFSAYDVVEYSEGIESSVIGSQRTATGVVRFARSAG